MDPITVDGTYLGPEQAATLERALVAKVAGFANRRVFDARACERAGLTDTAALIREHLRQNMEDLLDHALPLAA